jgi:hypothetical protein
MHPLLQAWLGAAAGKFPAVDASVRVVPELQGGLEASVAFTGHALIATSLAPDEVLAQRLDAFGGSLAPDFLRWLAGPAGTIGVVDVTLVARGRKGEPLARRFDLDQHPRVVLARSLRSEVKVHADERGLVTLSAGIAGRRELSIEAHEPGHGLGASLLAAALASVPEGEPVFAAVSPGNARSLRTFFAAGFEPIGSEVIIRPKR